MHKAALLKQYVSKKDKMMQLRGLLPTRLCLRPRVCSRKSSMHVPAAQPEDWSTWKASMAAKNADDLHLKVVNLRNEIKDFMPHHFHPTLANVSDHHMLTDISYAYVMYGSYRPNALPHQRISVRHMAMKHIETMENDPSKKEVILLLLWVMRDFGCL